MVFIRSTVEPTNVAGVVTPFRNNDPYVMSTVLPITSVVVSTNPPKASASIGLLNLVIFKES